jgi:hypothetical protein
VKVRFGTMRLDAEARQLFRGSQEVHLSGKAFELLKLLVERRPAALSKAEIKEHLWPDTFVSETNLPTLVTEIRDALGDDARHPRFLRTLHCSATRSAETLWRTAGGQVSIPRAAGWPPRRAGFRSLRATTFWDEARMQAWSSSHPRSRGITPVSPSATTSQFDDLDSKNGTYVGDQRITSARLEEGDRIRVGAFLLTFHKHDPNTSTSTQTVR